MTPPAATAAAARTARRSRARVPAVAPRHPRRVSGPARALPAPGRDRARRVRTQAPVPRAMARVVERVRTMPDAPVVDRLVRGRAWIALIGVLLMGLVAVQVYQLKLSASVSRAVQQGANLERRNGELRATVSQLSGAQRLQGTGMQLGMFMPAAGAIHFLTLSPPRDARRAASALRADRPVALTDPGVAPPVDQTATAPPVNQTAAAPAPVPAGGQPQPQPQPQANTPGGTPAPAPAPQEAPVDTSATGAAAAPAGP